MVESSNNNTIDPRVRAKLNSRARTVVFLCLVLSVVLAGSVQARQGLELAGEETDIKAAYLLNFLKFVDWPEDRTLSQDSYFITVLGDDGVADSLLGLTGLQIRGRELVVRKIEEIEALQPSHLVFIGPDYNDQLPKVWKTIDKCRALTVGETVDFVDAGGMLAFVRSKDAIVFVANQQSAQDQGITLSLQLLQIAISRDQLP